VGVDGRWRAFADPDLAEAVAAAGAVVSTIPADAAAGHLAALREAPVLLDAIYDPWPTPLAAAVTITFTIASGSSTFHPSLINMS